MSGSRPDIAHRHRLIATGRVSPAHPYNRIERGSTTRSERFHSPKSLRSDCHHSNHSPCLDREMRRAELRMISNRHHPPADATKHKWTLPQATRSELPSASRTLRSACSVRYRNAHFYCNKFRHCYAVSL